MEDKAFSSSLKILIPFTSLLVNFKMSSKGTNCKFLELGSKELHGFELSWLNQFPHVKGLTKRYGIPEVI